MIAYPVQLVKQFYESRAVVATGMYVPLYLSDLSHSADGHNSSLIQAHGLSPQEDCQLRMHRSVP